VVAASEGGVDFAVDVVNGVVGVDADGDVAGVVFDVSAAVDFAAQVYGDHPGNGRGGVFEEATDGFGEVFEEVGVDGDGFAAGDLADAFGGFFIEGVPRGGGGSFGVGGAVGAVVGGAPGEAAAGD